MYSSRAKGRGVAPIGEGVDVDALKARLRRELQAGVEVALVRVDAAIADQAAEVQLRAIAFGMLDGVQQRGILEEGAIVDGGADARVTPAGRACPRRCSGGRPRSCPSAPPAARRPARRSRAGYVATRARCGRDWACAPARWRWPPRGDSCHSRPSRSAASGRGISVINIGAETPAFTPGEVAPLLSCRHSHLHDGGPDNTARGCPARSPSPS